MRTFSKLFFLLLVFGGMAACNSGTDQTQVQVFDKQAHRGGRGLMPENTIAAQKFAIDLNCTMEMDVQMSKDKKIVVSHDAYFSSNFSLSPEGDTMSSEDGHSRLIFNMDYDSVAKYDVGMKPHPDFPQQKKMAAIKPLLSVLIDSVEAYAKEKNHVNHYDIEIKSSPESDGKNYSSLEEFVDSALHIIITKGIASRTMIQSFDIRALRLVHEKYPEVKTAYLIGKAAHETAQGYIDALGFKPDIFSPHYTLVTPELVKDFHQLNVLIIPWTPNKLEEIQQLKDMGVDGAITDYPDLYAQLK